jgi:hypothetical protein
VLVFVDWSWLCEWSWCWKSVQVEMTSLRKKCRDIGNDFETSEQWRSVNSVVSTFGWSKPLHHDKVNPVGEAPHALSFSA